MYEDFKDFSLFCSSFLDCSSSTTIPMISYVLFFPNFFAPVAPLFAKSLKLGRSKVSTGDSAVLGAIPGMSLGWSNCCKLAMKGSSNMLDVFIGKKGRFAAIQGTFTHLQYVQYTRI